jgi:hypothetical protein
MELKSHQVDGVDPLMLIVPLLHLVEDFVTYFILQNTNNTKLYLIIEMYNNIIIIFVKQLSKIKQNDKIQEKRNEQVCS